MQAATLKRMDVSAYRALQAQGFNRIPLVRETLADLDTPVSLYLKLAHVENAGAYSFLLESVVGGERFGRYSFIGLPAHTWLESRGFGNQALTQVVHQGRVVERIEGNPLDAVTAWRNRFKVFIPPGMPRFCGGLVGYFGYDVVRHIEPCLQHSCPPDTLGCPDILLLHCEELAVIDNLSGKLYLIVYADARHPQGYEQAWSRLDLLQERLKMPALLPSVGSGVKGEAHSSYARERYLHDVEQAREWIAAGDIFQMVMGQRLSQPFADHPLALYRSLRSLNPSPYMYYYHMGDHHIVGASPEILVRHAREGGEEKITIRPLAGTRPRGKTPQEDKALEEALLADPKERAEHVMLIDLARNDIGRIAKIGSVQVTEAFAVERYSHVMHIVSNVEGTLRPGLDAMDVLRATFPAGTLSGTPKVRAMELIDAVEPVKRGIYGGACGYLSFAGDMDLAIAIRTAVLKDGCMHVQAAAGVVADSVPQKEWEETLHKARALLRAAELAEKFV